MRQGQAPCHIFTMLRSLLLKTVKGKSNNMANWVPKAKKMGWRFGVSSRSLRQWVTEDPSLPLQENRVILTLVNPSKDFLHPGKRMVVQNLVSFPLAVAQLRLLSTFWCLRRKDLSQWRPEEFKFSLSWLCGLGTRTRLKCIDNKRLTHTPSWGSLTLR